MPFKTGNVLCRSLALLLWFSAGVSAQSDTVFPVVVRSSGNAVIDTLLQRFDRYRQHNLQEKLFVHTDRTFYLAGDVLWFKLYEVGGAFNKPLPLSKVAYLELLDAAHKPVLQTKIALRQCSGNGSLYLPFSLASGHYELRAYTNRMKNFSPAYYFKEVITVVNTSEGYGMPPAPDTATYDIRFFPEGGDLVNGLSSKVAFRGADDQGKGIRFQGTVTDEMGNVVAHIRPLVSGIGNFTFTPVAGHRYKAVIQVENGPVITKELPLAHEKGYVMQVSGAGADRLRISVRAQLPPHFPYPFVYLIVHTRQSVKVAAVQPLEGGAAEFVVRKDALGDGISRLTVFNGLRQPVCERLYGRRPARQLVIRATADKPSYALRQKVTLDLTTGSEAGQPLQADMSFSVYRLDSLPSPAAPGIFSYLWLTSGLGAPVEQAASYFKKDDAVAEEALDNLLLTRGWRRFSWQDVLEGKAPSFAYVPEHGGHIISGRITDTRTGKPAGGVLAYLSVPGKRVQLYGSRSNGKGLVHFDIKDFYGPNEIVVQTDPRLDSTYRIDILSPYSEKFTEDALPSWRLSDQWRNALSERNLAMEVQAAYAGRRPSRFEEPVIDTAAFFGKPSKTYLLDDYTRFTTMEEVMREYVEEVLVRKKNGAYHFMTVNAPAYALQDASPVDVVMDGDPLVLLDGVPVFNIDKVIAFDPLKVEKLDVVAEKYYWGPLTADGIVSYTTYKGDLGGFRLDPHAVVLDYEGLQLQREFDAPAYEDPSRLGSRMPDFRDLLCWSPSVHTNAQGKGEASFYTSDLPGTYKVVVQGITADGHAGSYSFTFTVKKQ